MDNQIISLTVVSKQTIQLLVWNHSIQSLFIAKYQDLMHTVKFKIFCVVSITVLSLM